MKNLIVFILVTLWLSSINPAQAQSRSDNKALSKFMTQNKSALHDCLTARNRTVEGVVLVELLIRPDGGVASAAIRESSIDSDSIERCLVIKFKKAQFAQIQIQEMRRAVVVIHLNKDGITMHPLEGESPKVEPEKKSPFRLLENESKP